MLKTRRILAQPWRIALLIGGLLARLGAQAQPVPDSLRSVVAAATTPAAQAAAHLRLARAYLYTTDSAAFAQHLATAKRTNDAADQVRAQLLEVEYACKHRRTRAALVQLIRMDEGRVPAAVRTSYYRWLTFTAIQVPDSGIARRSVRLYRRAAQQANSPLDILRARKYEADIAFWITDSDSAIVQYEQLLPQTEKLGNIPFFVETSYATQHALHRNGEHATAARLARETLKDVGDVADPITRLRLLDGMAMGALTQDSPRVAIPYYRQQIRLVEQTGQLESLIGIQHNLAKIYIDTDQLDSAETTLERVLQVIEPVTKRQPDQLPVVWVTLANLRLAQDRPAEAIKLLSRAAERFRELRVFSARQVALEMLHDIALQDGNFRVAHDWLDSMRRNEMRTHKEATAEAVAVLNAQMEATNARREAQLARLQRHTVQLTSQRQVAIISASLLAVILLGIIGGLLYRQRQRRKEEALRTHLAADLHDEVGGLLTQIALRSTMLQMGGLAPDEQRQYLQTLAETSQLAVRQMADTVWSIDARNDSLEQLIFRMRDFAAALLNPVDIELEFDLPSPLPTSPLPLPVRQALFLIFKESLNNVVKHSLATTVIARLELQADGLRFSLRDNGVGVSVQPQRPGHHGLENMQRRATAIGGSLTFLPSSSGFGIEAWLPFR